MAYITATEYIPKFGNAEAVRLTDESRSGAVDTAKVDEAIQDAIELAESYVGQRYTLPLVDVPRLLNTIVADLARERLHKTKPVTEVTEAADRARALLKDIAAGKASLPIDEGQAAPITSGGRAYTSGDASAPIFTDASFVGYNDFGSGYGSACWRR